MLFFFFKQKTAYEMRISDWSSDVCSSDLIETGRHPRSDDLDGRLAGLEELVGIGSVEADGARLLIAHERHPIVQGLDRLRIAERGGREIGRASRRERVLQYV